jgi:hypothetical protein
MWRLPCTAVTPTSTGLGRPRWILTHLRGSHPHAQSSEPSDKQVHSKVSLRRAVDAVQRCGAGCVRAASRVRRSGTTRKQPANLAVEGAEESLSILPDYTPTARPPPRRC